MQATADVVVIGAGAIGCSTAFHLAKAGIRNVAVVEMNQVGSGSSSKSASMLTVHLSDELSIRMAKHSYAKLMQFEEEIGTPIGFKKIGYLAIATPETSNYLVKQIELLKSLDVKTEILSPEEIKREFPLINTEDLAVGQWGEDDGVFDPHMIMWGYMKRAREMGVSLYQDERATDIRVREGKVEGVLTTGGYISTNFVVNAGGPWATEIGKWINVDIPIVNSARNIVVTAPFPDIPSNHACVEDMSVEWYFRPEGPGILMGMGAERTESVEAQFTPDSITGMLQAAIHRVPVLEKATMQTGWSGIRPMTIDDHPILGRVSSVAGFILNCGWGGEGITQSPLAGLLVAELISDGRTSIDIGPFRIERFAGQSLEKVKDLRIFARQKSQE